MSAIQPSPSDKRTLTAPLALIKVNGIVVGKMRNIRVTENITRGRVVGLGTLTPSELPATGWSGSLSASFYTIDFKKSMIPGAINRIVTNIQDWQDSVTLQEDGVEIAIFKRVKNPLQTDDKFQNLSPDKDFIQRIIKGTEKEFATIRGAFITSEGFDISEGSISGRDVSFEFTDPILFTSFN